MEKKNKMWPQRKVKTIHRSPKFPPHWNWNGLVRPPRNLLTAQPQRSGPTFIALSRHTSLKCFCEALYTDSHIERRCCYLSCILVRTAATKSSIPSFYVSLVTSNRVVRHPMRFVMCCPIYWVLPASQKRTRVNKKKSLSATAASREYTHERNIQ